MNKKLGYLFVFGVVLGFTLCVYEFIKIKESNSPAIEYLRLGPYVLIILCLLIAIAYAFGKLPSKKDDS